jgi:hypothetical protein
MTELQLLIEAGVNPEDWLLSIQSLKSPKLIDSSIAWILDDMCIMLELFLRHVKVHLIVEALNDVDLSRLEDVPPLVVPVVRLVDSHLFSLLLRCFRDIDELMRISGDDEARFLERFVRGDLDESPDVH